MIFDLHAHSEMNCHAVGISNFKILQQIIVLFESAPAFNQEKYFCKNHIFIVKPMAFGIVKFQKKTILSALDQNL